MKPSVLNQLYVKSAESGSDHIELTCSNPIKCANCQSDHPADSRNCLVWKREKEINTIKYTQNISFPEARKIVQSQNQFPTKSYSQVTKSNTEAKHNHPCTSCHTILEKLSTLTPENLPKFISELKASLSESTQPKPSTSQSHISSQLKQPPRWHLLRKPKALNLPLDETPSLLAGDLGKATLLVRGSSWRKPTQKIDFQYLRMRSRWSVGFYHHPPLSPRPMALGRNPYRLQNLNVPSPINNHH